MRAVHRVTKALCHHQNKYIQFPTTQAKIQKNQREFMQIRGFPRVIGAIDGTHIRLFGVIKGPDEYVYINRKGQYSINVQLACDANYNIINVVARWPGSTHDSRILQESRLFEAFEAGQLQGLLLGDSGYALKPWLMTPILNPRGAAERAYNIAHRGTRVLIEQLNGQLKTKFMCLGGTGPKVKTPQKACDIVVACCILFNMSKTDHIQEPIDVNQLPPPDDLGDVRAPDADDVLGIAVRNELLQNVFS